MHKAYGRIMMNNVFTKRRLLLAVGVAYSLAALAADAPSAAFTAPLADTTLVANVVSGKASLAIAGNGVENGGTIKLVELLDGGTVVASAKAATLSKTMQLAVGSHSLQLRATDTTNVVALSNPLAITVNADVPPAVTFTGPQDGGQFIANFVSGNAAVPIAATATDSDGTVAKIELLDGATAVATVAGGAFNKAVQLPVGSHTLSVRATDNSGGTVTSGSVNVTVVVDQPPSVSLTAPGDLSSFLTGPVGTASVTVTGSATDPDDTVAKIALMDGSTVLATVKGGTFNKAVPLAVGPHSLQLVATDNYGATASTNIITVQIAQDLPPSVDIPKTSGSTLPASVITGLGKVTVWGQGYDNDGTVAKVELVDNGKVIANAVGGSFNKTVNLALGSHSLVLRATDNNGVSADSAAPVEVDIVPDQPPTVQMNTPFDGSTVDARANGFASVLVNGYGIDDEGSVVKLEVLDADKVITSVASGTLNKTISLGIGAHSLSLRATDDSGGTSVTPPAVLTVLPNQPPVANFILPQDQGQFLANKAGKAPIQVIGNGDDPDGKVTKIELLDGGSAIASASGASLDKLVALAPGKHSLQLRVTDNAGGITVNDGISVNVLSLNKQILGGLDGVISGPDQKPYLQGWTCDQGKGQQNTYRVYVDEPMLSGGTQLGGATADQVPAEAGVQQAIAQACGDNLGHQFRFDLSSFNDTYFNHTLYVTAMSVDDQSTVDLPCNGHCQMPGGVVIGLISPHEGDHYPGPNATFFVGTKIVGVDAAQIDHVDFLQDGTVKALGTTDASLGLNGFSAAWVEENASSTPYYLSARVALKDGRSVTAADVGVYVDAGSTAPTSSGVDWISPVVNGHYGAGSDLALQVSAGDANGAKVQFYQGTTMVGQAAKIAGSSNYSAVWHKVPAGSYNLSAKLLDASGAVLGQATALQVSVSAANNSTKVYYIYTDQLDTPRMVTDEANNVVWQNSALKEPFGNGSPDVASGSDFELNLRFPGQYYDKETGLNYNGFRDYDPATGRYVQSDPLGLNGGQWSSYAYVDANSIMFSDLLGLGPTGWVKDKAASKVKDYPKNKLKEWWNDLLTSPAETTGKVCALGMVSQQGCGAAQSPGGEAKLTTECLNRTQGLPNTDTRSFAASGPFLDCYNAGEKAIQENCNTEKPAVPSKPSEQKKTPGK